MKKNYRFSVAGEGSDGLVFDAKGTVKCEFLTEAFDKAMTNTFDQLTTGRAVYGSPGVGCKGPYTVHRILIELEG